MRGVATVCFALVVGFASLVVAPATARAASAGPWHVNQATGHSYQEVYGLTWEEAEAYARSVGGHLVTINNQAEDDWLEATFPEPNLWIGLTDRAVEGKWVWVSGEPVTYTNWCPGQPDDWPAVGGEDYGFMNTAYCGGSGWDDAAGGPFPGGIVEVAGPRTISIAPFVVRWDSTNPEAITYLSWDGSPNLTNSAEHPNCPGYVSEFFGNSWGTADGTAFIAPVGWGATGAWAPYGLDGVQVASAGTAGCYGTTGIPIRTSYTFFGGSPSVARIQVERAFDFGVTPFASDLRPYIPRLSPADSYAQVLYPRVDGVLVSRNALDCHFGCQVVDWTRSWYAVHDPRTGRGMIVRHEPSPVLTDLWIDVDAYSASAATSVVLRQPTGGFTGTVVEREVLCLYDRSTWVPSATPPTACQRPWAERPPSVGSKLGLPATAGAYTARTKVSPLGAYVTWRGNLGLAAAAKVVGVEVATKRANGTWTPFARVTSRVADASGGVVFSRRQGSPAWISVRFVGAGVVSGSSQARWR